MNPDSHFEARTETNRTFHLCIYFMVHILYEAEVPANFEFSLHAKPVFEAIECLFQVDENQVEIFCIYTMLFH